MKAAYDRTHIFSFIDIKSMKYNFFHDEHTGSVLQLLWEAT